MRIGRNLVGRRLMNAVGESRQRIDLSLHHAVRIVARQAHLRARTVAHQKILRDLVDILHVRIVATRALDVAVDQLHGAGWVGRLALRRPATPTRFDASFSGSTRLKGCDPVRVVPKESALFMVPTMGNCP